MAWNAVIDTATQDLLRHGFSTLTFDAAVETLLTDVPRPKRPRRQDSGEDEDDVHRWNGTTFDLVTRDIAEIRRRKILRLTNRMESFVEKRYSTAESRDLNALMIEGISKSLTNRVALVQTWIDWLRLTIDELRTQRQAINAATTPAAVRAVDLDIDTLRTADPNVRVRQVENENT